MCDLSTMHFRQKLKRKERYLKLLFWAKIASEITIVIGILMVLYMIINNMI
jgi:hypothetical protein